MARSGDFKNWAIPQAAHEWVLILDCDERITPALADEIRRELSSPRHDGYWIYRRNHFLGHPIRFGPWKNDSCLRLFRRDLGRYVGETDHAEVELSQRARSAGCGQRMTHYTCSSYTPVSAEAGPLRRRAIADLARGRPADAAVALAAAVSAAISSSAILAAGLSRRHGRVQVCALVAYLSWLKHAYLWKLQNERELARTWRSRSDHASANRVSVRTGRSAAMKVGYLDR